MIGDCMQDWQKRVLEEHAELSDKVIKLSDFINSDAFDAVDAENQDLLRQQRAAMVSYMTILSKRVSMF